MSSMPPSPLRENPQTAPQAPQVTFTPARYPVPHPYGPVPHPYGPGGAYANPALLFIALETQRRLPAHRHDLQRSRASQTNSSVKPAARRLGVDYRNTTKHSSLHLTISMPLNKNKTSQPPQPHPQPIPNTPLNLFIFFTHFVIVTSLTSHVSAMCFLLMSSSLAV